MNYKSAMPPMFSKQDPATPLSEKLLKWLLLAVPVAVLVYGISFFDGVLFLKTVVFTGLITLSAILFVPGIIQGRYRFKATWIDWSLLVFLAAMALSTVFSANPYTSFWSTTNRMTGLFVFLHLAAYYLMVRGVFQGAQNIRRYLRWWLTIGALEAIYIILQQFVKFSWMTPLLEGRSIGTIGNPIFTGDFMAMITLLAGGLLWATRSRLWRWIYGVIAALGLISMILLAARGPILGLVAGTICIAVFGLLSSRLKLWFKTMILGALVVVVIGGGLLIWVGRDSSFVQSIPVINRFAQIDPREPNVQSRLLTWQVGLGAFVEKPLLGYGPENFSIAFQKVYQPVFEALGISATQLDKAHNNLIEYLVTTGLVGALSYLGVFIISLWLILSSMKTVGKKKKVLISVLGAIVIVYFVQGLTSIETLAPLMLFACILAIVANIVGGRPIDVPSRPKIWWIVAGVIVIAYGIYSGIQYHVKPAMVSYRLFRANALASQGQFHQALQLAESGVRLDTFIRPSVLISFGAQVDENVSYRRDAEAAADYMLKSAQWMEEYSLPHAQGDAIPLTILGGIYSKLSSVSDQYITKANQVVEQAVAISPKRALTWLEWGKVFLVGKDYKQAAEKFDYALSLNDKFAEAHILDAIAKAYMGDFSSSAMHINRLFELEPGLAASSAYSGLIVDAYLSHKQNQLAIDFLKRILETYPSADATRGQLAALYKAMGRIADARKEAEYILNNSRNLNIRKAAQDFIDSL